MKTSAKRHTDIFQQASLFPMEANEQHWLEKYRKEIKAALDYSSLLLVFNPKSGISTIQLLGLGILPKQVRVVYCAPEKVSSYAWQALANDNIGFIVSEQEGIFENRQRAQLQNFKLVA
ncbi:hypothetical protein [Gynuella sp.]|uniref:hypothetical protein n=1 Tax=Gynuella sp. TaxID=2969146 RepID=UPI003D0DBBE4